MNAPLLRDLIGIPDKVFAGDFVLRLSGVSPVPTVTTLTLSSPSKATVFPDNLVAFLGPIRAWHCSTENARAAVGVF